ncbi:MAG: DNA-binding response regulator [Dyadobacter sp. 50-39]|uniref:LytR/AlgR family response regulator transcription factor n=1 Tax=Dyadobacter sp. 50-39 TaxID=1895756 RepID=UPI0009676211|nr:LytTR family DNA-binding domain-containing protein [Dyadobacter sp. 50-39]OJV20525.1 MAG: DNA-binding response regulator [Dyadobacter sp. 50-39]
MKVLILEDEALSATRASQLLLECNPKTEVLGTLESVEEAAAWFNDNPEPDLLLLDIHLSDGLCFGLFERIAVKCPVIFTTAYDRYALQAFKMNSIDYLLKPLDKQDLTRALAKYEALNPTREVVPIDLENLRNTLQLLTKKYKTRFLVKYADNLLFKNVDELAYFYADDRVVFLVTNDGKKYLIDNNLESLEEVLDPAVFFRVNRKIIAKIDAIQKVKTLFSSRLQVFLAPPFNQDVYVSKYKSQEFKSWLDS